MAAAVPLCVIQGDTYPLSLVFKMNNFCLAVLGIMEAVSTFNSRLLQSPLYLIYLLSHLRFIYFQACPCFVLRIIVSSPVLLIVFTFTCQLYDGLLAYIVNSRLPWIWLPSVKIYNRWLRLPGIMIMPYSNPLSVFIYDTLFQSWMIVEEANLSDGLFALFVNVFSSSSELSQYILFLFMHKFANDVNLKIYMYMDTYVNIKT